MKKSLMILASVALGASMAVGSTNVESKNIVGFGQAVVAADAYFMAGINFQDMNGSNYIGIQNLFPTNELYTDVNDPYASDQILVFDGAVYTAYFYADAGIGPMWYDEGFAVPSSVTFKRGDAFWFKRAPASTATNLTLKGQVPVDTNYVHTSLASGYTIICGAFPNVTSLNALGINAYTDVNDPYASDQILIYNSGVYTAYFYADAGSGPMWYDEGFAVPTTAGFAVGQGAWYLRQAAAGGSATWTEAKPY